MSPAPPADLDVVLALQLVQVRDLIAAASPTKSCAPAFRSLVDAEDAELADETGRS